MTEIERALDALTAAGIEHDDAVHALEVLTEAGFLVARPQSLLDTFTAAALAVRQ